MKKRFIEKILPWLNSSSGDCVQNFDLSKGIYLYGAGDLGALALDYCEACDIQIMGFLDRVRTEDMISRSGHWYTVSHPNGGEDSLDKDIPVAVAISTSPYGPIADQLRALNWKTVTPFYNLTSTSRAGHPLANGWFLGDVSNQEKEVAQFVCNQWADETSWLHYQAFIAWHRDNTEIDLDLAPIDPAERYALPELQNALQGRQKIFVDVGSHHGESISRMNSAGIVFREYHLFEPDSASRAVLERRKEELVPSGSKLSVYADVLNEGIGNLYFQAGLGYCSQIWRNGVDLRQGNILDAFNLNPDFLKIHTEGTEIKIIKGARETIERSKPIIAYSVYHRREGFCSDIAEAMKLISGYSWFFRLHSFQGTGAFVYAIPTLDS